MRANHSRTVLIATVLSAALAAQTPLHIYEGHADGDAQGMCVRIAGDINKDGIVDLVTGAPRDDGTGLDTGSAWVFSGDDKELIYLFRGPGEGVGFGYSVDSAGDVNLDGYDDLIIGAPYEDNLDGKYPHSRAGAVQVISGRDGKLLYTFRGPSEGDGLGWSVTALGDLDGDDHPDLAVGAPFYDRPGAVDVGLVRIYSGRTGDVIRELQGNFQGDRFGWSICRIGDINRDRVPELLVGIEGSAQDTEQAGSAQLFSGRTGELIHTLRTGQTQDYFGAAVANAGDINGDHRDDLIVGGWNGANTDGVRAGIVIVFSGRSGKPLLTLSGDDLHDRFGSAVAAVDDLDRDGRPDIAVGAPQDELGAGYVRVFSSKTGQTLFTIPGHAVGDAMGTSVSGIHDQNGDDIPDLLVGAPGFRERGGWMIYATPTEPPK